MKANILILEDNDIGYKLISMYLKDYNLIRANTIGEAIMILDSNKRVDLMIIDVYIKGSIFSGMDLLNILDEDENVIVCTGIELDYVMEKKYKKFDYIRKPYSGEELKKIVNKRLKKDETVLSEAI